MGVSPLLLTILITLSFFPESTSFEIVNNCNYTIWPGLRSTAGSSLNLSTTGFTLKSGASFNLSVPKSWTGQVWGRTLCNQSSTRNFSCFTADCGTGKIECDRNGGSLPATLAEFSLNLTGGMDYYDVSLVTTGGAARSRQQQLQLFGMLGRLERLVSQGAEGGA
ncbi:PREDICTED: glucan endo-1,3-beta-glucosidase-like [Fragaria vesca subsp. vesca]